MADELWRWDATAITAAVRKREISAREAVESCLARKAEVNPKLNAVTVDLSAQALAAADRADQAVARGDVLKPLHGVPVTIKENVDQEGCATTNGVVSFANFVAGADSPIVTNWKRAGAIIIGRTNTPAFSFRLDTVNDLRGRTYSPWSQTHTPGRFVRRRARRRWRPASRRSRTATTSPVRCASRRTVAGSPASGLRSDASLRSIRRRRPSARCRRN